MRETYLPIYREVLSLRRREAPAASALAAQTAEEARDAGDAAIATFFDALSLRVKRQYDEAIPLFEECLPPEGFPLPGELFFELGRAHAECQKPDYCATIEFYQKALDEESYDTRGDAWFNMGLAYGNLDDHDKAIECSQKALAEETFDTPGDAWLSMGNAYLNLGNYEKAIEFHQKALAEESFDGQGDASNNMGVAYHSLGNYHKAIECYDEALGEKSYDRRGDAWYNMGNAYRDFADYDKAIECYHKALAEKTGRPGYAWNNMGSAYGDLGDYDKAIECFEKALAEKTDRPGSALANMARAYQSLGEKQEARDYYEQAVDAFEKAGARLEAELVQSALELIEMGREAGASAVTELVGVVDPSELDKSKKVILEKLHSGRHLVKAWAKRKASDLQDVMVFLKGWSSCVPWLIAAHVGPPDDGDSGPRISAVQDSRLRQQMTRGGGYFLKWSGYGTVIDPGVSFVTNFLSHGFHAKEVHHVFTTHSHVDHTADLMPLQSIVQEYNEWAPEGDQHDLLHFWDAKTCRSDPYIQTCDDEHRRNQLGPLNKPQLPSEAAMTVTPIDSQHCEGSVSLLFELMAAGKPAVRIGLTSDAAPEAAGTLAKAFQGCDVIILHFSKTTEEDLAGRPEGKSHHLGYSGCKRIIEETDADLYVIAEFSGETGDYRYDAVKSLALETRKKDHIIPADIGLTVCLPGDKHDFLGIRCSQCGEFCRVADVRTVRPPFPFGLITYVCPECTL